MREVVGTREATKRETRRALLDAALAEFTERGFDAPSLDAICARAGFTRGAFYVHFSNRDELVSAAMEHAITSFVAMIMPEGEAAADIGATIDMFANAVAPGLLARQGVAKVESPGRAPVEGPKFHIFLEACTRSDAVREGMTQSLVRVVERLQKAGETGQSQGTVREDVAARDVGILLLLWALGVFSAAEIGVELDTDSLGVTALRLLRPA
jgi:AcrR family transcriptional regulator